MDRCLAFVLVYQVTVIQICCEKCATVRSQARWKETVFVPKESDGVQQSLSSTEGAVASPFEPVVAGAFGLSATS
jgi:hypothetical protein